MLNHMKGIQAYAKHMFLSIFRYLGRHPPGNDETRDVKENR